MWKTILQPHFRKRMNVDIMMNMIAVVNPEKNVTDVFCIFSMVLEDTDVFNDNRKKLIKKCKGNVL